jgi:hypothetical protein
MKSVTIINRHKEKITATVGQPISFKYDHEQTAEVLNIRRHPYCGVQVLVEAVYDGQGGKMWQDLKDCWE